jgi:hypothetical protein
MRPHKEQTMIARWPLLVDVQLARMPLSSTGPLVHGKLGFETCSCIDDLIKGKAESE